MASNESTGNATPQPNLHAQDLSTLNVATLTPLSPEVISRQATINIGTIGHVAHGKSTVVKAISGVQTVRFKNELERNITIKLERLQFGPDGKVIQPKSELKSDHSRSRPVNLRKNGLVHRRNGYITQTNRYNGFHTDKNKSRKQSDNVVRKKRKRSISTNECNERVISAKKKISLVVIKKVRSGSDKSRRNSSKSEVNKSVKLTTKQKRVSDNNSSRAEKKTNTETYKKEFVVERILAHVVRNKKQMFLVKWQGWAEKYNSWEPLDHLTHCERVFQDFLADSLQQKVLDKLKSWLKIREATMEELNRYIPNRGGIRALPDRSQLQRELLAIAATSIDKRTAVMRDRCKQKLMLYWIHVHRDRQLASLRQWEQEMNEIAREDAILTVENDVDLEAAPAGFLYVNDYVAGEGAIIPDDPPIGCECKQCGGRSSQCCASQTKFAYRRHGRINVPQGTPIYECNRRCRCDPNTCRNRVVQLGRRVPLCIFRTSDERGWGVRTLRKVYYGEFVCEYVGEVISFEEAERRGRGYDAEGRTYLFDLDFNSHDFPYTVDAATYGNVSHFINHSCAPNLGVWAVWVNCLDPNIPRLALFATTDIAKGEEITFDYMCNVDRFPEGQLPNTPTSRTRLKIAHEGDDRPQCKCGASTCRRYLF